MDTGTVLGLVLLGIIVNVIISHLVAETAKRKEIGYDTTFFLSFLFSPLIGLLISIASPMKEVEVVKEIVKEEKT